MITDLTSDGFLEKLDKKKSFTVGATSASLEGGKVGNMRITLCGSTKFKEAFEQANRNFTMRGHIVYSVAFFGHADGIKLSRREKSLLDAVHMVKILNSDAIYVIDVDGYIGESTEREIEFAKSCSKQVFYLSKNDF